MASIQFTDCVFDNDQNKIVNLDDDNLSFNFMIVISLFLLFVFTVCSSTRKYYTFYQLNGNIIKLPVNKYFIFKKKNKILALNRYNKDGIEMILNKNMFVTKYRKLNFKN